MKKIELTRAYVDGDAIRYEVREDLGLGLLRQERVNLFIHYHFNEGFHCNLTDLPLSILALPISLYMVPITYFYDVELVIPEMDRDLYEHLPRIYEAYSKIYGPFKEDWRGKVTVKKIVENKPYENPKYDKVVFFSGGVDACHAGISNPGRRSLLVSIPDIEARAKNEGPLREEKFSLIKSFAKVVNSDYLLVSNNFNACLFRDVEINRYLGAVRGLSSPAYKFDGWYGIRYVPNMCSVAPIAYLTGIKSLIMGSTCEALEGKYLANHDGAHPEITSAVGFSNVSFAEQEALEVRRTTKVSNVIRWCKEHGARIKLWACFSDGAAQCGFCRKCVRTQLNILCAGENPRVWGFDKFSEKEFHEYIKAYRYVESNPCWLWDNIDFIDKRKAYPHLDQTLHWLKRIGYKKYTYRANVRARLKNMCDRALAVKRYPHYFCVLLTRLMGRRG